MRIGLTLLCLTGVSDATVEVYGSFATGLMDTFSDLDVVVWGWRARGGPHETAAEALTRLAAHLREAPWVGITQVLTHARVPIIKLDARLEGQREVRVDLSLECPQHTGIATAALVCALGARLPPLVPLTLVLKSFLRKRGLCDPYTGGLPSYGLALMATFLLLRSRKRLQVTDRSPPLPVYR
jgi:non-canonical poly(A) RNA polymerase PAPD5/7